MWEIKKLLGRPFTCLLTNNFLCLIQRNLYSRPQNDPSWSPTELFPLHKFDQWSYLSEESWSLIIFLFEIAAFCWFDSITTKYVFEVSIHICFITLSWYAGAEVESDINVWDQTSHTSEMHSPNGLKEWNRNSNLNLLHWFSNLIQK